MERMNKNGSGASDARRKFDDALGRINRLRELRDQIASGQQRADGGSQDPKVANILAMLDSAEAKSSQLMASAQGSEAKLMRISMTAKRLQERGSVSGIVSGLGGLVGNLGKGLANSVQSITNSAVPITRSILDTTASVAKSATNAAASVSKTVLDTANNAAVNMVNSARNTSSSLLGQTSNIASSLTKMASGAMNTICGAGSAAAQMVNGILNPAPTQTNPTPSGVNSMVQSAANAASGLMNSATSTARSMLEGVSGLASGLVDKASSSVGSMIGDAAKAAGNLIGGAAQSLVDGIFGKGKADASGGADLFGAAASLGQAAFEAGGNAVSAATDLLGGLASGCADLASGILGSASEVAGGLADTAIGAASSLLDSSASIGQGILDAAGGVADSIFDTASDVGQGLLGAVGDLAGEAASAGGDLLSGLTDFAGEALDTGMDLADAVVDTAVDLAADAVDVACDIADSVLDSAADVADALFDDTVDDVEDIVDDYEDEMEDMTDELDEMEEEFDEENWDEEWTEDEEEWEDEPYEEEDDDGYDDEVDDEDEDEDEDDESDGEEDDDEDPSQKYQRMMEEQNQVSSDSESESTTPNGDEGSQSVKDAKKKDEHNGLWGWKPDYEAARGLMGMIHDGDQQLFNPYGHSEMLWTVYSFRPCDAEKCKPQIAITPASFQALDSMNAMLNRIPYIVVKEYYFKNTASTMMNFVKKIAGAAKEAFNSATDAVDNGDDADSKGSGDLKSKANGFLDKVKEVFKDVLEPKMQVIDIPYILYVGLRKKQFGNTYIFPYIVDNGTIINQASNASEWGDANGGGLIEGLKKMLNSAVNAVGGFALGLTGSQARPASLFPAPTWNGGNGGDKVSFSFDLMLINDNALKARNNYMCVNTIINNNRQMQKTVLRFPGALYEIWLPTGQRHLMCTGDFKLYPLGLNRQAPDKFFHEAGVKGANRPIGDKNGLIAKLENEHQEKAEVIPDGYKLQIQFTSCLANNLNTSVFQYYVKMTGYENYGNDGENGTPGHDETKDEPTYYDKTRENLTNGALKNAPEIKEDPPAQKQEQPQANTASVEGFMAKRFARAVAELVDENPEDDTGEVQEKFEESTYNKKLQKIQAQFGDKAVNADSVVQTIRSAQRVVRETTQFLRKLYNADSSNLWYRPVETDELYTTIDPDYRKTLRRKYGQDLKSIKDTQKEIARLNARLRQLETRLAETVDLSEREALISQKVDVEDSVQELQRKLDASVDSAIQTDVDLLQYAFDNHDRAVSLKRRMMTPRIFQQVWNEKIMNSYEKDKLQYLTSDEKRRYFEEKVRDLAKCDTYHVLNHPDWFFRVVVLDFVVDEIQRLIVWFKNCSYSDFDTIYRIVRKLNLLMLDVDAARDSTRDFDINRTNLFHLSDEDMQKFTDLDNMLNGNTLYELFISQLSLNFVQIDSESEEAGDATEDEEKKELEREQESEVNIENMRKVRQDVVVRFWGSESNLTKDAYDLVNVPDKEIDLVGSDGKPIADSDSNSIRTIRDLKNEIIRLKVSGDDNDRLGELLGVFSNQIMWVKEKMVMEKMQQMKEHSESEYDREVQNVNVNPSIS